MPTDVRVTTELLYRGAWVVALVDVVYVALLAGTVKNATFYRLKWPLAIAAALIWYGIWSWAIGNYWEAVYSYVFPAWAQTWAPWIAFVMAGLVAFGLWNVARSTKRLAVLTFCLLGGAFGSVTHIWAVERGILTKPPMLQGASPFAAVVFAFFEYLFYWCAILTLAKILDWVRGRIEKYVFVKWI